MKLIWSDIVSRILAIVIDTMWVIERKLNITDLRAVSRKKELWFLVN